MRERTIIRAAKILSTVFNPFYLPLVGLAILFLFSLMRRMPWQYIALVFIIVYLFTVFCPSFFIRLYQRQQGWSRWMAGRRERRMVPYLISILCYFTCYYMLLALRVPVFIGRIIVAALMIQIICAMINIWWKISTHTAGIGGVTGSIMVFALLFFFNPIGWLILAFFVAGLVGVSRMILCQHTLSQVVAGFFVGMAIAIIVIL